MNKEQIKDFWQNNPCGQTLVSGSQTKISDFQGFFLSYDKFRYATEGHILANLDAIDFKNKNVLEIGIGQAADSAQIIERGGNYHGIDITSEACQRAITRFDIFKKPYKKVICASATQIPFPDNYFDIIYSHGVLHHIPDIAKVVPELNRVLKKDGKLVIMLYAKNSLNYYLSILFFRRLFLVCLMPLDFITGGKLIENEVLRKHLDNCKQFGIFNYFSTPVFLSHNTDGPDNPYSRVYSPKEVQEVFDLFDFEAFNQHFVNERQLPIVKLFPKKIKDFLSSKWGWHLWCYGVKK